MTIEDVHINLDPVEPEKIVKHELPADEGGALLFTRLFIMFGGLLPFIPQYVQIWSSGDESGFSTHVCLVVIFASCLRVAYWVGHWYDNALLFQAIFMTFVMLALMELCLRVGRKRALAEGRTFEESRFFDFKLSKFWQWTDLWSYVYCTLLFVSIPCVYTSYFREIEIFIEPIGFAALITESLLGVPQIIKNFQNKSTEGMNILMIIIWTLGEALFKDKRTWKFLQMAREQCSPNC